MTTTTTQSQMTAVNERSERGERLHAEFNRWSRRLAAPAISAAPPIIVGLGRPNAPIDFHHLFLHRALNAPEERPQ